VIPNTLPSVNALVTKGDSLYIEYHIENREITTNLVQKNVNIAFVGNAPRGIAGVFTQPKDSILGNLYRGWGQFVYNGNRDRANQRINKNDLEIDPDLLNSSEQRPYHPEKSKFVLMVSLPDLHAWRGYDNLTYIQADTMSSSRLGEDGISPDNTAIVGVSTSAFAPNKISKSETHSISANISASYSVIGGSLSGSKSWNETVNTLDAIDMNGDRYPDIVGVDNIQYTTARGGLEKTAQSYNLGTHQAKSEAEGAGLGGGFVVSAPYNANQNQGAGSNKNTTKVDNVNNQATANGAQGQKVASTTIGVSGSGSINVGKNDDETTDSWLDVNADGLIDKIFKDGSVALNLGYRLLKKRHGAIKVFGQVRVKIMGEALV
jgi:hypothetical protein